MRITILDDVGKRYHVDSLQELEDFVLKQILSGKEELIEKISTYDLVTETNPEGLIDKTELIKRLVTVKLQPEIIKKMNAAASELSIYEHLNLSKVFSKESSISFNISTLNNFLNDLNRDFETNSIPLCDLSTKYCEENN